jgi:hypothetical protein
MSAPTLPGRQHQSAPPAPPAPPAQRGTEPPHAQPPDAASGHEAVSTRADSEDALLVDGYLAAVAARLDQRGIMVRELRATGSSPLAGVMTLDGEPESGRRWLPTRLSWQEHQGWTATLCSAEPTASDQRRSAEVPRYLPRQLVPAPETVAHFVAALNADAQTIWARNAVHQPQRIDRRWLRLQLSRFALPEPW